MIQVTINDRPYDVAQGWQELPLERVARVVEAAFLKKQTPWQQHTLLQIVLGISEKEYKTWLRQYFGPRVSEETIAQNAEELYSLFEAISWIWRENLTVQPFKHIQVRSELWWLPSENFQQMSWGELADGFIHSKAYAEQVVEGEHHLHLLIATICRPRATDKARSGYDWNGDEREAYNEHHAQARAKATEELDAATKAAIYLYFVGTMNAVFGSYELWGDGGSDDDYPGQSFVRNTFTLAEKGIFGGVPQTRNSNLHEVLLFLEENNRRERELREAHERANAENQP
jgi:hypothetical protein